MKAHFALALAATVLAALVTVPSALAGRGGGGFAGGAPAAAPMAAPSPGFRAEPAPMNMPNPGFRSEPGFRQAPAAAPEHFAAPAAPAHLMTAPMAPAVMPHYGAGSPAYRPAAPAMMPHYGGGSSYYHNYGVSPAYHAAPSRSARQENQIIQQQITRARKQEPLVQEQIRRQQQMHPLVEKQLKWAEENHGMRSLVEQQKTRAKQESQVMKNIKNERAQAPLSPQAHEQRHTTPSVMQRIGSAFGGALAGSAVGNRPRIAPHLNVRSAPLNRAFSMPEVRSGATAAQRQFAERAVHNMYTHVVAVPLSQAPSNFRQLQQAQRNQYLNNYRYAFNNQALTINAQNTYFNRVAPGYWPYWYQPVSGWNYCNSFVLGSDVNCGPSWFNWWSNNDPCYGAYGGYPGGFVCANDYMPTPWMYNPYCAQWMQPGYDGYPAGPGYNYTGPITVEVLERKLLSLRDRFSGRYLNQSMNVPYMYNAYYYPSYGRWGFVNRSGFFNWLNI